ncbi:hypothetical protein ACES3O_004510 [Salmonella enterica]
MATHTRASVFFCVLRLRIPELWWSGRGSFGWPVIIWSRFSTPVRITTP